MSRKTNLLVVIAENWWLERGCTHNSVHSSLLWTKSWDLGSLSEWSLQDYETFLGNISFNFLFLCRTTLYLNSHTFLKIKNIQWNGDCWRDDHNYLDLWDTLTEFSSPDFLWFKTPFTGKGCCKWGFYFSMEQPL